MKAFQDKRSIFWLGGVTALVLGILAAFLILPATSGMRGSEGPEITVPKMQNIPPADAPNIGLEVERQQD